MDVKQRFNNNNNNNNNNKSVTDMPLTCFCCSMWRMDHRVVPICQNDVTAHEARLNDLTR